MNNSIMGNISTILQINPELTSIYTNNLFSENLTWSTDLESMRNQVDIYSFVNKYVDRAVEVQLKYNDEISNLKTLVLAAQDQINTGIINENVSYRVVDATTGEELEEWKDLSNKTVPLGFYNPVIPATPEDLETELNDWLIFAIAVMVILIIVSILFVRANSLLRNVPSEYKTRSKKSKKPRIGVRDDTDLYIRK